MKIKNANPLTQWVKSGPVVKKRGFPWFGLLFWVAVILLLVASCYQLYTEGLPY